MLEVPRSSLYADDNAQAISIAAAPKDEAGVSAAGASVDQPASAQVSDVEVIAQIRTLINQFPTYGYRRITALLRRKVGLQINHKRVYRLLRQQGWMVTQRSKTPKPRVRGSRSQTEASNVRWAIDLSHVYCGDDGWGHLVAVIDCHDREIVGWEFARRGRAQEAERALEMACLARYGTVRPTGATPVLRSDNGLVFLSRRFTQACAFYRVEREYITPYTPEQNGLIERFFRSFKEECVWLQHFSSFAEAQQAVRAWLDWYNRERPHQALGYRSPQEYRQQREMNQLPQTYRPAA